MTASAWSRAKSYLNHRVLHNQFLLALRAAEVDLEAGRLTGELEAELLGEVLPRWSAVRTEIESCASQFEEAMSPGLLLETPPLNGLGPKERAWFHDLVDGLWRVRHRVEAKLADLAVTLEVVNCRHSSLVASWTHLSQAERVAELHALADACADVSRSLSSLPSGARGV